MYLRSVYVVVVVFRLKRMLVHVYCISHNYVYNFLKLKIFQIIHAGPLVFSIYLKLCSYTQFVQPGAVARLEACSLGMQAAPSSIPTSGTFFRGDLVMKTFLRPFSLFR